jgi:hypothetical protein
MSDVVEKWLVSGRYAWIERLQLKPLAHRALPRSPVRIRRGQADVFPLQAGDGRAFMLKRFHHGRLLNREYLIRVSALLPRGREFAAGTNRAVLTSGALQRDSNAYYAHALAAWLNDTVLMPRLSGSDWVMLADELRSGRRQLAPSQRLALAQSLARVIEKLENHHCSHRDLTGSNVFIDRDMSAVQLIDFDSLCHPSLTMPSGTTCGTPGYLPSFVCRAGTDPRPTWCERADRFALALLIGEFLAVGPGAPWSGDGGLFDQEDLTRRRGVSIDWARDAVAQTCPQALPLLDRALASRTFAECPSPREWQRIVRTVPDRAVRACPRAAKPATRSSRIPRLSEIPEPLIALPPVRYAPAPVPTNTWTTTHTRAIRRTAF